MRLWEIGKADERGRQNVLAGVLLHVVAAAVGVDTAVDRSSLERRLRRGLEVVNHAPIFRIGNLSNAQPSAEPER